MEFGLLIALALFFVAIFIGLPLAWVFLGCSIAALILIDSPLQFIAGTAYAALDSYIFMAVAFFILAGNLMSVTGIADRLINLAYALVGRIKGGLVDVGIVTITFMAALTGSALSCIAATVPVLVPRLEKYGYQPRYVTAVLCSVGFLGFLIPPSIPFLIYAMIAKQSVAALFLSTVFPALILSGGYMVLNTFLSERYRQPSGDIPELPTTFKGSIKEVGTGIRSALPALGTPLIVLVGIYAGIFTPNEAGAIAVVYTVIVGLFFYRELTRKNFWAVCQSTLTTLGMITLLLAFGTVFTRLAIREGVAQALAEFMIEAFQNKYLILFMLNILLLILGMFIEGLPILIIIVPLILPLVSEIGVNPIQMGAIIVINVSIGLVTPPFAMSLFVGSKLSGVPYEQLIKPMVYFLVAVNLPVLFLTNYIPALTLWLPTVVVGSKIVGPW